MRHFEYMLSIARGFWVPEEEQRQAPAEPMAGREHAPGPPHDAAAEATAGKLRTHRPSPPWRSAS
jgi:hypothetical protein